MVDESLARAAKRAFCVSVFKRPPEVATAGIAHLTYYAPRPVSLQERPVLEHLDTCCSDCGGHTVPCWMCEHNGDPRQVPMTSQAREIRHIGICDRHGCVDAHCPASTHLLVKPVDVQHPHLDPPGPIRAAAIAAAVGLLLGMVIGAMLAAPALIKAMCP